MTDSTLVDSDAVRPPEGRVRQRNTCGGQLSSGVGWEGAATSKHRALAAKTFSRFSLLLNEIGKNFE